MANDTPAQRVPDLRDQLEAFNEYRRSVCGNVPPVGRDERIEIERTNIGGDVE